MLIIISLINSLKYYFFEETADDADDMLVLLSTLKFYFHLLHPKSLHLTRIKRLPRP